jgi:hypothetical protein
MIAGVEAREVLEGFDQDKIMRAVASELRPYHVVHVFGLCRASRRSWRSCCPEDRSIRRGTGRVRSRSSMR